MDIDKKDYSRHASIVRGVKTGDEKSMLDLYTIVQFHRYALFASVGAEESEDKLHDIYIAVVEAIRRNKLADPRRLSGLSISSAGARLPTRLRLRSEDGRRNWRRTLPSTAIG